MPSRIVVCVVSVAILLQAGLTGWCVEDATSTEQSMSMEQKVSYVMGFQVAQTLMMADMKVDLQALASGIQDVMSQNEPAMTDQELQEAMQYLQKQMQQNQASMMEAVGEKNAQEAEAFLAQNKEQEGVKTLPSGLQYKVLASGEGDSPTGTDKVRCHYVGTFLNGEEFDSSYKRGQPAEFQVNGVIQGWTQALQMMKEGDKWRLFVPPDLAYGANGPGGMPPNSLLIFEVELLEVLPQE